MTRNFLEGARKERLNFTPSGLWRAWQRLDAASKVYVLTVMGLIISVSHLNTSSADLHLTLTVRTSALPLLWLTPIPCLLWLLWDSGRVHGVSQRI